MLRVMIAAVLCLTSMPLAGCATTGSSYSKVRTAVERAAAAYARIRGYAEAALPFLPEPHANRVRIALALADVAIARARLANTAAEQDGQLRALEEQTAVIVATTGS